MIHVLLTAWLALPIAPLNPIKEDTVAAANLQLTFGTVTPNGVVSAGPEFTIKYELRYVHHFITRAAVEYHFNELTSRLYPRGNINNFSFAGEGLLYHGTNKLMGFIGFGGVLSVNTFNPWPTTMSTLKSENVTDISLRPALGYRFIFGFRWRKKYALEFTVTELYSDLRTETALSETQFMRETRSVKTGSFRVS
ncbi:MAG: hypothetical protein D6800_09625, partial [Candidatus Zixiibacteriota bacterium]